VPRTVALDASYSLGSELTGVGVYSRELLDGLAGAHPSCEFLHCFRPHHWRAAFSRPAAPNVAHRLLWERAWPARGVLFHGLNQRLPAGRFRRSVCTFHDLFVLTGEYSTPEFRARFARQAREAAARADLIIAVSAFTAGQVADLLGVGAARVRVIPHGVRLPPPGEAAREPVVLSVGAVQRRKNTVRIVQAFELACPPPWRLVLAGGSGYGVEEVRAAIEASPARERILHTGHVTNAGLARWYARASLFAFPSLDEGFGMPVLEAMAAGVPVVASCRSALPEVCGDAAVLVEPESVEAIAGGFAEALRRGGLVEKGRARAREFTWEKAVSRTWEVYRELEG
jgi:glycosyltransferase involved in cell wall biosynthesis